MKINKSTKVVLTTFIAIWILTGFSAFHIAKYTLKKTTITFMNIYDCLMKYIVK